MYAVAPRSSAFPLVTFFSGVMLLVALLTSTGILEPHKAQDTECGNSRGRLARALGGEEITKVACLGQYRGLRF